MWSENLVDVHLIYRVCSDKIISWDKKIEQVSWYIILNRGL